MPNAMPVVDADVMRRCYDVVNAMFTDHGIHPDMIKQWWWRPHGKFEDVFGYRAPIDALLDGQATDVYQEAELHCEILRPLQKARH